MEKLYSHKYHTIDCHAIEVKKQAALIFSSSTYMYMHVH